MILHIEKLSPDVYSEHSRDYQIISRVFDAMFNGVKYDAESTVKLLDTKFIREEFLPLLQTKLGYESYVLLNYDELRYILSAFPYIIRNKGSLKAIELMICMCLKLYSVNANIDISIGGDGTVINSLSLDKHSILIGIDTVLRSTQILQDLCRYVMPPGFSLYVYFYTELPISLMVEFEDKVELVYSSTNVASRLKSSTANFRLTESSPWLSLGQYWGVHTKIPTLAKDEISSLNDKSIAEMLLDVDTSGMHPGNVIRTVELRIVNRVNTKVDLNKLSTKNLRYGDCVVVKFDESQDKSKQFYKWLGNKFVLANDDVRYWVWQTESILPPSYYYRSRTPLMYWYQVPDYLSDIFDNNDFIYLKDLNDSQNDGYYRFNASQATCLKINDLLYKGYIEIPSIGKYDFYVDEELFLTKTKITVEGQHTINVGTVSGSRMVFVDSSSDTSLYWNENFVNNFGLTIGERIADSTMTGDLTNFVLVVNIIKDEEVLTRSGSWVKIDNKNIDFVSGPILGLTSTNNVVNTVGATLVADVSITNSNHYLGIYTNINELQTKFVTPQNGDMAIVGTTEYYYHNGSWRKSELVTICNRNSDGTIPISISLLPEYSIIGVRSASNKVYFKYTKFTDSETHEDTYKWVKMRARGSIGENLVYNPRDYDFVNPTVSPKYFYNGEWKQLNDYLQTSSKFPETANEDDYILIQGVTYYIVINGSYVDITDTAHILEVHKYDRDGREVN